MKQFDKLCKYQVLQILENNVKFLHLFIVSALLPIAMLFFCKKEPYLIEEYQQYEATFRVWIQLFFGLYLCCVAFAPLSLFGILCDYGSRIRALEKALNASAKLPKNE